jgi:predicted dinucleotide-binding enzyme
MSLLISDPLKMGVTKTTFNPRTSGYAGTTGRKRRVSMNVTIIGNGKMAKGIGLRLANSGHSVHLHVRDIQKGEELAKILEEVAEKGAAVSVSEIGSPTDKLAILATPYGEVSDITKQYDGFADTIIVDITNPVDFDTFELIPEPGKSGAEEIAVLMPKAKVIKAFNSKELDVMMAGDDQEAKAELAELIKTSALRPVDVGPLANARHLEGLGLIHMAVQDQLHTNWGSTIKILG